MAKKTRVGIVGGGQLGALLAEGARRIGVEPVALTAHSTDPAFKAAPGSMLLHPTNEHPDHVVHDFFHSVDVVAVENEFFPDAVVQHAGADAPKMTPSFETLAILRDKARQKELCDKLGFKTAPFARMPASGDAGAWIRSQASTWGGACVLKAAQGGYDGRGVCVVDTNAAGSLENGVRFADDLRNRGVGVYAEKKIPFKRELALVAVKGRDGFFTSYPLVVSENENSVCKLVTGPAKAVGVDARLESQAVQMAGRLAVETGLLGVFAIEFFEDADGQLLVNEIAPRVHNSGHFSIDASETSQFTNHWHALLGISLGDTTSAPAFAMLNLLGPAQAFGDVAPVELKLPAGVTFHDYGKTESRPGRKMGHLTAVAENPADMPALIGLLRGCESQWLGQMQAQARERGKAS